MGRARKRGKKRRGGREREKKTQGKTGLEVEIFLGPNIGRQGKLKIFSSPFQVQI